MPPIEAIKIAVQLLGRSKVAVQRPNRRSSKLLVQVLELSTSLRPAIIQKWKIVTTDEIPPFRPKSRNFALKASASDELAALRAKINAVEYCLAKKNITISEEAMKMVPIYDGLKKNQLVLEKNQLQKKENQLQEKENKLIEKKNKLIDLEIVEKNILLKLPGKAIYLAFLE